MPRDVEALARVIGTLTGGFSSLHEAQVKIISTLVDALGMAYGALWSTDSRGSYTLAYETGDLTAVLKAAVSGAETVPADAGMLGAAVTARRAVTISETPQAGTSCLRWQAAHRAGMVQASLVPVEHDGVVTGVLEFFSRAPLPAFASDKWAAITRIAVVAGLQAVAAAQLRETLDDRAAVTTVVADVGEAGDQKSAIRVALERVRTPFGWAYGSYEQCRSPAGRAQGCMRFIELHLRQTY